jgi:ubiquinone/menaquinone biosynthesis C-methylase UbiE
VNGNAQCLPFPDDTFDQIVSTFPTQYITAHETILEMHRVLRSGGDFIILPFAWITGGNILHKVAAWLFKITGQAPAIIEESTISNELDRFTRAGFKSYSEFKEFNNSKVMLLRGTKIIG